MLRALISRAHAPAVGRVVLALAVVALWPAGVWAQHDHPAEGAAPVQAPTVPVDPHAGHQPGAATPLPSFIPVLTDADRAAAFPDLGEHRPHGGSFTSFVLADHLEWQTGRGAGGVTADLKGWVGGDLSRLWFRTSGSVAERSLTDARVELFYGRPVSRWWDLVAGIRKDVGSGPTRTWAAIGLQGLAPLWFEVEATAYIGSGGTTELHVASEYEVLLTNRLVLQTSAAVDVSGKADTTRRMGAGFSSIDAGLRLRYEITREFAPYIGIVWDRAVFATGDRRREAGERVGERRLVAGARVWF
jgi:copper resistance protein B